MISRFAVLAIACAIGGAAAFWSSAPLAGSSVPVEVGGEAEYDACGSLGIVVGLDPQGDNFLAVRSGPGTRYQQIDSLFSNDEVLLCQSHGSWHGIVYGPPGADCGVGTPIMPRQTYRGPCRAGWVFDRYIRVIAG